MDNYVILDSNNVVFGPIEWSRNQLAIKLYAMGYAVTIGETPIEEPLIISDTVKIMPIKTLDTALKADQVIDSYDIAIGTTRVDYTPKVRSMRDDEIAAAITTKKAGLKTELKLLRKTDEDGGFTSGDDTFESDKATIAALHRAYDDLERKFITSINWKLPSGYKTFVLADMKKVIADLTAHTQSCFNKEMAILSLIDAVSTLAEINKFDVKAEWNKG